MAKIMTGAADNEIKLFPLWLHEVCDLLETTDLDSTPSPTRGAINVVSQLLVGAHTLCVRHRHREARFAYEPGLAKCALALLLLNSYTDQPVDMVTLATWLKQPRGFVGGTSGTYSWVLYWHDDERLGTVEVTEWYGEREHATGLLQWPGAKTIAAFLCRLHHVMFPYPIRDFRCLTAVTSLEKDWEEKLAYTARQLSEVSVEAGLSQSLYQQYSRWSTYGPEGTPTLVHNDIHPGNLLANKENCMVVIDWDNACVAAPELDFVKLKHWSELGRDGRYVASYKFLTEVVREYVEAGGMFDRDRFRAYEILWLGRIIAFEARREMHEYRVRAPFRESRYYVPLLEQALNAKTIEI